MKCLKYTLFIFVFSLFISCSTGQADSDKDIKVEEIVDLDLDKIKERGKLVAIFDNSSTSYFIYRGQPMGYEYDLLSRFCKEIGVEMEIMVTSSIEQAFSLLNEGKGDVVAFHLTVTKDRKERIDFSNSFVTTRQVLVQRKPENWRKLPRSSIDRKLIRNQVDLIGKRVHVRQNSSFVTRLESLSDEIGGDIIIDIQSGDLETEALIKKVAEGEIEYTVSDKDLAQVNAAYYPILDVNTPLSFPQRIAWGIRKTAPGLKTELNKFIDEITSTSLHQVIYNKYFRVNRKIIERAKSDLSSISGERISEYDELIKLWADSIQWDWRLMSSMVYQESRFNPTANSWAGAKGLMQLMPITGKRFYATNLYEPKQNIRAGALFLDYLDRQWKKSVPDSIERQKFILASYNVGMGHVQDAVALADELGYDTDEWTGEVEKAMKLKADPEYFRNEVVKYGYCRGESVVKYVQNVLSRFEQYRLNFPASEDELAKL